MILVNASVWIDFFRNTPTPQAEWLDAHLGDEAFVVGDLILAEVLRGFKDDRGFNEARRLMARLEQVTLCGEDLAVEAARNFRRLRSRGVTVRGTIDVVIATRCIADGLRLLHSDRDFEPFVVAPAKFTPRPPSPIAPCPVRRDRPVLDAILGPSG